MKSDLMTVDVDAIHTEHRLALENATSAVDHAVRCGELLIEKKTEFKHGEWQGWMKDNLQFTLKSANVYMRAAAQKKLGRSFSSLGRLLILDKPPAEPKQKRPPTDVEALKRELAASLEEIKRLELRLTGEMLKHSTREHKLKEEIKRLSELHPRFTDAERKLILSCLHTDTPTKDFDRCTKAFQIFNRTFDEPLPPKAKAKKNDATAHP